ncbi:hypothetical protein J2S17_005315 [Cytobacillus purgationiresistens]|uniref:Uncharacterized protein n=1 Tax=Cytobacillus purgationiresistens TaxID=863449 RepID=A0ABU0AQA8_9BACI|nr:hypothetical protein [Cytobacillus purgationiresistens]
MHGEKPFIRQRRKMVILLLSYFVTKVHYLASLFLKNRSAINKMTQPTKITMGIIELIVVRLSLFQSL